MSENKCGGCTMCCKLPAVVEVQKPAMKWCKHCEIGKGCGIYETRPLTCSTFKCYWLVTQEGNNTMPLRLRPDKTKAVISPTTSGNTVAVLVDRNMKDIWHKGEIYEVIKQMVDQGLRVVVGWDDGEDKIMLHKVGPQVIGETKIKMTKPDENGMQWFFNKDNNVLRRD